MDFLANFVCRKAPPAAAQGRQRSRAGVEPHRWQVCWQPASAPRLRGAAAAAWSSGGGGGGGGGSGSAGGFALLADVLAQFAAAYRAPIWDHGKLQAAAALQQMRTCWQLAQRLSDPACRRAVESQLQLLAASAPPQHSGPLLTAAQLQYVCALHAAEAPPQMLYSSSEAGAEARRMHWAAVQMLLQLEPHSPRSLCTASYGYWVSMRQPSADVAAAMQGCLDTCQHAYDLAQQQRDHYFTERAAGWWLSAAAGAVAGNLTPSRGMQLAALAAFEAAQPSLRACKRLLPAAWVDPLESTRRSTQTAVPLVQAKLRGGGAGDVEQEALAAAQAAADVQSRCDRAGLRASLCAGCGRTALGLRACSRCKQARYCRLVQGSVGCWVAAALS